MIAYISNYTQLQQIYLLPKLTIVLTGGIASGKTYVSSIFHELGFVIISSDILAHDALDHYKEDIVSIFGKSIIKYQYYNINEQHKINNSCSKSWSIDRDKLSVLIFSCKYKKKLLENILFPHIHKMRQMKMLENHSSSILLEIPLFFEENVEVEYDIVIATVCSLEKQKHRAFMRKGMTDNKFNAMISGQINNQQRISLVDYVIDTNQSKSCVRNVIYKLFKKV